MPPTGPDIQNEYFSRPYICAAELAAERDGRATIYLASPQADSDLERYNEAFERLMDDADRDEVDRRFAAGSATVFFWVVVTIVLILEFGVRVTGAR